MYMCVLKITCTCICNMIPDVKIVRAVLLTKFSTCTCTCTAKFELALTASEISFSNFLRYLRKLSTGTGRYWPVLLEIFLEI